MIANIGRGSNHAGLATYLHGPGKANEHKYGPDDRPGGVVISSNIGREGDTSGAWAGDLRRAAKTREDIKKPVLHVSLRNTKNDRTLSDAEWSDIAQDFAERMGYEDKPWVAVRHGDDHIHIAASRVDMDGNVWHGRNDFRQAQRVVRELETEYNLEAAPRQKTGEKTPKSEIIAQHKEAEQAMRKEQNMAVPEQYTHTSRAALPKEYDGDIEYSTDADYGNLMRGQALEGSENAKEPSQHLNNAVEEQSHGEEMSSNLNNSKEQGMER
ncbi:relaxase/mobilization nuclease domain-containing protein [Glutamicibacter arilaitensis]|uniref:relaxase/mobilization nuclease domain-containing protein n=1 Tax=Glutamicibacter arilaitensis TaxID=256701 RepID=UPI003FD5FB1B